MRDPISRRSFLGASALAGAAVAAGCTAGNPGIVDRAHSAAAASKDAAHGAGPGGGAGSTRTPEGQLPGDPYWRIRRLGAQDAVEGYTDSTDVLAGEPFALYLSSTARRVRVEAFRIGWYRGALARRVWMRDGISVHKQPVPAVRSGTNTVTAGWERSLEVATDGWPEGAYVIRLTTDHGQRFVPFVVRSADAAGKLLLVHATSTYQAYNTWGGYSLYEGPGGAGDFANRARVVSFDRPYDLNGASRFLAFERSVVSLVDRLQLPVAYTTSTQVHRDPELLSSARAIVSLGHDEYWSPRMRANVTAARDAGVNIAFLGANACFRRVRFQAGDGGPDREVVCYKSDYAEDPLFGKDDAAVTNDYREPPAPDPECTLTGTYYEAFPTDGAYRVCAPHSWVFRGTDVHAGSSFPHLVGPEYDRVNPVVRLPRPMQVLAHSPVICKGIHTFADSAYYTASSGAGVFSTGTMGWTRAVLRANRDVDVRTARFVTRVTANVLSAFKDGPAAERHPALDNLDLIKPFTGDPTWVREDLW